MMMRRGIGLGALLAALLSAAPAAGAPSGVVYGGETSQRWPVVVQEARDGKSIAKLVVALSLKCGHGAPIVNRDRFANLRLAGGGRFESRYGPVKTDNGDGTKTDYRGSVSGRLTSRKGTAVSRLSGDFHDASGKRVDTCDSGKVSWTARP